MDHIRILLAVMVFGFSVHSVVDLLTNGFDLLVLVAAIAGFWITHIIWPHDRRRQNNNENDWVDFLGDILDLPYQIIVKSLRMVGSSRDGDAGIGGE